MMLRVRSLFQGLAAVCLVAAAVAGQTPQRVLGDLSPDRVRDVMEQFNHALGVECTHCHVQDKWDDESKTQFGTARNMFRMVQALNQTHLRDIGEISCWTCHRGEVRPSRVPRAAIDAALSRWPAELANVPEQVKTTMAVYSASLGVACDHCHVADWKKDDKAAMKTVATMNAMFKEFPKYMPATARTQCFMCHKGSKKPAR
jgi:hypothetical protein